MTPKPWRRVLRRRGSGRGRGAGCERIVWSVWTKNPKAAAFYRKLGAEPDPEEQLMSLAIQTYAAETDLQDPIS